MVSMQVLKSGKSLEYEKHDLRLENFCKISKIDSLS